MVGQRAKIITETGDFLIGVRGALGVTPLAPATQDEDVRIEFLDRQGLRCRYAFGTFSEFFHMIGEAAVPVIGQDAEVADREPDFKAPSEFTSPTTDTPLRFRELVTLALKTTDSAVLDLAEQDYRGVYASINDYICNQIGEHLPPYLQWLLACCNPEMLRVGYERGLVRIWTIGLANDRVIVFESQRKRRRG
jgi:hypothetical protein